ncbi:LacI family DNA-binding transcriptional regulator [Bifidobacterium simiiventris]|uniref:LacI family DNA-binding transcriptional regulator n=1 Tax=Bifidobacterium simiiventris TaxID=2834434 RepID=UPI001C573F6F|nr:LacI family DNA-binding transcriptional regulator [Bifidobacterium simiiventris]MBW3079126.1 LacI family DNA-binding transcriptional regulator [Bifidobacterium simiiventris]
MATIVDVARRAGVAVSTVSYVLSGKRPVKADTKVRVMRAAREVGYVPAASRSSAGRPPISRDGFAAGVADAATRTHVIAVSSPLDETTVYGNWSPFVFSVAKCLRQHGCNMLLLTGECADEELLRAADSGAVDGALLLGVTVDDARAAVAGLSRVPVVSIGCARTAPNIMSIDLDFEQMGRKAIDVMAKAGHRRLLFVGGEETAYELGVNFLIRTRAAILDAAKRSGIDVQALPMRDGGMQEMRGIAARAFARDPRITGILGQCGHTSLARLKRAIEERGLAVPRDVSMLELGSFGNGGESDPPIDEIPLQPYAICRHAVDLLMDMIDGRRDAGSGGVKLLPVSYLRRGSIMRRTVR